MTARGRARRDPGLALGFAALVLISPITTRAQVARVDTAPGSVRSFQDASIFSRGAPGRVDPNQEALTLLGALERSLARDPSVQAAVAGSEGTAAGIGAARADLWPSLGALVTWARFEEPMLATPIHAFPPDLIPEFDRSLFQGALQLDYELWDGGGRSARIQAARGLDSSAASQVREARQRALLETLGTFLAVLSARDGVMARDAHIAELESERLRVERLLAQGSAARVELLRAEAEASAARAEQAAAQARLELAEANLATLLELEPAEIATRSLEDVGLLGLASSRTPAERGESGGHPAVVAARGRADAAHASVRAARSSSLPRLSAHARFIEYGGSTSLYTGEWQAGVQLEYAAFTGGARRSAVERAQADARRADADVAVVARRVEEAVDAAFAREREARARAAALDDAVTQYEELARVEALALAEGAGVQRDFLRAQAGLLQARTGLAEATRSAVLAAASVAWARGLLSIEWIEQNVEIMR